MSNDPYLSFSNSLDRLKIEYEKYKKIIVAVDHDDTVYDFHKNGSTYTKVISLIKDCISLNFHIVVFTGSKVESYPDIRQFWKNTFGLEQVKINENAFPMDIGNNGKIYYNILLDDRAGLSSAVSLLEELISWIKGQSPKRAVKPFDYLEKFESRMVFLGGECQSNWRDDIVLQLSHKYKFVNPLVEFEVFIERESELIIWEQYYINLSDSFIFNFSGDTQCARSLFELALVLERMKYSPFMRLFICIDDNYTNAHYIKTIISTIRFKENVQSFTNLNTLIEHLR